MNPIDSKKFQKILKESKRSQKILRKASIAAKHSAVPAGWPKKANGHPLRFKELSAPALLGHLKRR